jgi:hypothetical protein
VTTVAGHRSRPQSKRSTRARLHAAYSIPQEAAAERYDAQSETNFVKGEHAGGTSDDYIRDTVFLATVLFLVGISSHFRVRSARYGLVGVGTLLLLFSVIQLLSLQAPS